MQEYFRSFDDCFGLLHFSLSKEETEHVKEITSKFNIGIISEEEITLDVIENEYIRDSIERNNLGIVSKIDIKLFSKSLDDKLFVGVARFIYSPEEVAIALPTVMPLRVLNEVKNKQKNAKEELIKVLLENNYSESVETDVVDKECVVTCDIRYTIGDDVISNYENQIIMMYSENDLNTEVLIGAKINDIVLMNVLDNVATKVVIKKIEKMVPYNSKTDKKKIEELGFDSYEELEKKFIQSYKKFIKIDKYIDYVIDFATQNTKLSSSNYIYDFYKDRDDILYYDLFKKTKNIKDKKKIINKCYVFDVFYRALELNGDISNAKLAKEIFLDYYNCHLYIADKNEINNYLTKYWMYTFLKEKEMFD